MGFSRQIQNSLHPNISSPLAKHFFYWLFTLFQEIDFFSLIGFCPNWNKALPHPHTPKSVCRKFPCQFVKKGFSSPNLATG